MIGVLELVVSVHVIGVLELMVRKDGHRNLFGVILVKQSSPKKIKSDCY